jgi:hypothetical protein
MNLSHVVASRIISCAQHHFFFFGMFQDVILNVKKYIHPGKYFVLFKCDRSAPRVC